MGSRIDLSAEVPLNFWESRLITRDLMEAASVNPSLWKSIGPKVANFDVNLYNGGIAWQESAQQILKRIGPSSGFPVDTIPEIIGNVASVLHSPPKNMEEFGYQMAEFGVGVAVAALSPIPIVGQIASAIGAVANMLIGLTRQSADARARFVPPFQDYSEEVDETVVNDQVLPSTSTLDWTRLFMPRFSGSWELDPRQQGWAVRGRSPAAGVGFMPGTQRITGIIQTYFVDLEKALIFQQVDNRDVGAFYPGAAQIMTAVAEIVAKPQTQLYNIDTRQILDAWESYYREALDMASAIYKYEPRVRQPLDQRFITEEQRHLLAGNMIGPLLVSPVTDIVGGFGTVSYKPWEHAPTALEKYIRPWCEKIRERQWHYLGRITGAAYTSEEQAAFRDPQMLTRLRTMRQLLLGHEARWDVQIKNMIDPEYADALFATTAGGTITAGPPDPKRTAPIDPENPPDACPGPPAGGVPFGDLVAPRLRRAWPYVAAGAATIGAVAAAAYYWEELAVFGGRVGTGVRRRLPGRIR